ncbi:MAG: TIR domain-containing protein [Acidobacteria bacterium]|nr:TIR domain-containing protein [Acidobacteriota bacterium]
MVFLSYAQEDEVEVERHWTKLRSDGFRAWMAKGDIVPGEDWERSIWRAVHFADFFIACVSSRSVTKRGFLQKEIKEALEIWKQKLEDDIYLIPLRLDSSEVPDSLRKFQWIDFNGGEGYTRLVNAISEGISRLESKPSHLTGDRSVFTKEFEEHRPMNLPYEIVTKYPEFKPSNDALTLELNATIAGFAFGQVQRCRKQFLEAAQLETDRDFGPSLLDIDYTLHTASQRCASIEFKIWTYYAGAAHPNLGTVTLNFLTCPLVEIELGDIFKPESDYLRFVSQFCVSKLGDQIAQDRGVEAPDQGMIDWILQGAGPKEENFQTFVINPKGIVLFFDPYRVSSYAEGRREVHMPWGALQGLLGDEVQAALPISGEFAQERI